MERTPDEIKKGLECCSNVNFVCNEECPYYKSLSEGEDCCLKKNADALALIQQLEDHLREAAKKIEQLQAERDAAVADLRRALHCPSCANWRKPEKAAVCFACQYGRTRRFEWRGVQKEE